MWAKCLLGEFRFAGNLNRHVPGATSSAVKLAATLVESESALGADSTEPLQSMTRHAKRPEVTKVHWVKFNVHCRGQTAGQTAKEIQHVYPDCCSSGESLESSRSRNESLKNHERSKTLLKERSCPSCSTNADGTPTWEKTKSLDGHLILLFC